MLPRDPPESIRLSFIIPAYNEAERILPYLERITAYMGRRRCAYELLVVDDGSEDGTASVVEKFSDSNPEVELIRLPQRRGKGAAVRRGMQAAVGQWQLFADADGATPIEELIRLETAIEQGADIAIGSRALASRLPNFLVRASWYRTILGGLFNQAVRQAGIRGISDTQCGFKLFRRAVAEDLFAVTTIDGYGFDLELLYIAQRRGYRIAEVPVNWADQPGSKVRVLRDGLAMIRELATIRQNDHKGLYSPPSFPHRFAPGRSTPLGFPTNR
ncbi:MAG TPA: dolichyl-phosphate beta-glucosyltransferase [Nitrospira sp.]|nr:dolichyl-phosphate beta-glucosyltransferase [Nitrospira sp.]